MDKKHYVYALLDSRKPGYWCYQIENHEIEFEYEPFYIGKGCGSRLTTHLKETINNPELKTRKHQKIRSILKTGTIIPKKIVLNLNSKEALELEIYFIESIGRIENNGPLVNLTSGGDGLINPSQETREKIGQSSKGRIISESTRKKLKANWINKYSLLQRIMMKRGISEEEAKEILLGVNAKRSEKMKTYKHSPETKLKISLSNSGKKKNFTTQHRSSISKSKKGVFSGKNNPMYGKTFYDIWSTTYDDTILQQKKIERNKYIKQKNEELLYEAQNTIEGNYNNNIKIQTLQLLKQGLPLNEALEYSLEHYNRSTQKGILAKQTLDAKKFWDRIDSGDNNALILLHHCKLYLQLKHDKVIDILQSFNIALNKKRAPFRIAKLKELEKKIQLYGITL
jgi:hypothetical protein